MTEWEIDFFSDTKTRPTAAMRAAMAAASVGDEQQDEDPTVEQLNSRVARLLGKEAALFLPSGTMANLVASLVHCQRGDEILAEASSHVLSYETGGPAAIAGAMCRPITGSGGMFTAAQLEAVIRPSRRNSPRPRLVWIEQTTNFGGGRVWPLLQLKQVRSVAQNHRLRVHMDGARLLNAVVASGVAAAEYGAVVDSLWIDFTKGLGAPFGAVLAGSEEFIEAARRYKHMLGGAMRQAGIMAAACLYALDHHVARLAEDHAHAAKLAEALQALPGLSVAGPVETNIVLLELTADGLSAHWLAEQLALRGIRVGVFGIISLRLITHLDINNAAIDRTVEALRQILGTRR